jgi:ribosomal protein S11
MNSQADKLIGSRSITPLTKTIRESSEGDRRVEDARLKKRQKRQNPEPASAGSRAGSVAAGTPGLIAPEAETKAPSKKELKKGALAAKLAEASSTASANQTLSTLMGRKKGKTYSWMTAGGSGASTPNRPNTPGTPGLASAHAGAKAQEEARLTKDGKYKLGSWREYTSSQGKNVQLRDWVAALDMDGLDPRSRQAAYAKLDTDGPR